MKRNTTKDVEEMSRLSITGNIIPPFWFSNLRAVKNTKNGESNKPHLLAIVILSDIVYWYKPQIIRDETTGQVSEISKKFAADKLQKSPSQLSQLFGVSKLDASEALQYLVEKNLISTELRTIIVDGKKQPNTMFISVNIAEIERISYTQLSNICEMRGTTQKNSSSQLSSRGSSQLSSRGSSQLSSRGSSQLSSTNTETTNTETTNTETTISSSSKISHEIFEGSVEQKKESLSPTNEGKKEGEKEGVSVKKTRSSKKAKEADPKTRPQLHIPFISTYQDFHASIKGSPIPNTLFTEHVAGLKKLRLLMIELSEKFKNGEASDDYVLLSFKAFLEKSWEVCKNDPKYSAAKFSPKFLAHDPLEILEKIKNNTKNGTSTFNRGGNTDFDPQLRAERKERFAGA